MSTGIANKPNVNRFNYYIAPRNSEADAYIGARFAEWLERKRRRA